MHFTPEPALLFFVFGLLAGLLRSNLDIPQAVSRFLSLYLLMALGLKGGFALARTGLDATVAATHGSVSAVTFITATQYLESQGLAYGGPWRPRWR